MPQRIENPIVMRVLLSTSSESNPIIISTIFLKPGITWAGRTHDAGFFIDTPYITGLITEPNGSTSLRISRRDNEGRYIHVGTVAFSDIKYIEK